MEPMTNPSARPVQLAVMTTPDSSLGEAVARARRQRESVLSLIDRMRAIGPRPAVWAGG